VFYSGDPGLGILIVPVGAVLLLTAVFLIARSAGSASVAAPPQKKNRT
jgi:hypothetical protein